MPREPRVGDLVVCGSRPAREQLGLGLEVGLYLVGRRRDAQVYFPGAGRSAWLPRRTLVVVDDADPRVPPPPRWMAQVPRAMRLVEASHMELERSEPEGFEVRLHVTSLDSPTLRRLEDLLGPGSRLRILPGGMTRLVVAYPAHPALDSPGPES